MVVIRFLLCFVFFLLRMKCIVFGFNALLTDFLNKLKADYQYTLFVQKVTHQTPTI